MPKKSTTVLSKDWQVLNDALRDADEDACRILFQKEKDGANRATYLRRIHGRLNRVRAKRERKELQNETS